MLWFQPCVKGPRLQVVFRGPYQGTGANALFSKGTIPLQNVRCAHSGLELNIEAIVHNDTPAIGHGICKDCYHAQMAGPGVSLWLVGSLQAVMAEV